MPLSAPQAASVQRLGKALQLTCSLLVPSQLSLPVKDLCFMRAKPALGVPSRRALFSDLWLITATADVQGTPSAWGLFIWTESAAASTASSLISQQAEASSSHTGGVGTGPFLTTQELQTCLLGYRSGQWLSAIDKWIFLALAWHAVFDACEALVPLSSYWGSSKRRF